MRLPHASSHLDTHTTVPYGRRLMRLGTTHERAFVDVRNALEPTRARTKGMVATERRGTVQGPDEEYERTRPCYVARGFVPSKGSSASGRGTTRC